MAHYIPIVLMGAGLSLVAACGSEASGSPGGGRNETAITATPAAAAMPDAAGARSLIDRIYSSYRNPLEEVDIPYTPELEAAIERQSDDDMGLGYDPFCMCQDPGDPGMLRHTLQSLTPTADGADARVSFVIGTDPSQTVLTIRLAKRGSTWMVADVVSQEGSLLKGGL